MKCAKRNDLSLRAAARESIQFMSNIDHRRWARRFVTTAALCGATGAGLSRAFAQPPVLVAAVPQSMAQRVFFSEGVLGTSMQLILHRADASQAQACQRAVDAEIQRLSNILSTYSETSHIRQVMRGAPIESSELADVLSLY